MCRRRHYRRPQSDLPFGGFSDGGIRRGRRPERPLAPRFRSTAAQRSDDARSSRTCRACPRPSARSSPRNDGPEDGAWRQREPSSAGLFSCGSVCGGSESAVSFGVASILEDEGYPGSTAVGCNAVLDGVRNGPRYHWRITYAKVGIRCLRLYAAT